MKWLQLNCLDSAAGTNSDQGMWRPQSTRESRPTQNQHSAQLHAPSRR